METARIFFWILTHDKIGRQFATAIDNNLFEP